MRMHRKRSRPAIESLEDRRVPATWGVPWADPQHLTASFVPDGTVAEGQFSQLYRTLDSQLGAGKWESTLLKAVQTWAATSNINVGLVADGGEPLGVAGPAQGDARFGDIRIAAEPLPADVAAITSPYHPAYGTTSGDIILNSNDDFKPNDPGSYDLFTVALHESGHVFGFADSSDPSSFMYDIYQGPKTSLAPGTIPALQALYGGTRAVDTLDKTPSSTDPTHPLNIPNISDNATSVSLPGDLPTAQTSDYFSFQAPNLINAPLGVDLKVQTSGISLLAPKVSVYDAAGHLLATASASGPLVGGASVHLAGLLQGQNDTVQVQGATGDVFSVGSYELTYDFTTASASTANPTAGSHPLQEPGNYSGSTPLTVGDPISQQDQEDVYSFKAPTSTPNGVTISLQDWGVGLTAPQLTVYDSLGNVLGSAAAANAASPSAGLHLALVVPNATYYVRVVDGEINPEAAGTYQLTASFTPPVGSPTGSFAQATPWFGSNDTGNGQPNNTLKTAGPLQTPGGEAPQSRYQAIEGLSPSQPQQFYKLDTPNASKGQSEVMTVSVQVLDNSGLLPLIGVFDKHGDPVNAQVLSEQDGVAVVQVPIASPGASYYLEVSAAPVAGTSATGNFYLDATFGSTLALIGPIASGNLAATPAGTSTAEVSATLSTNQTQLFSFVLAGAASNTGTDAIIQMNVVDASGNVVATLSSPAALAESTVVCLAAGNYTILIDATSPSGKPIPTLAYSLTGTNLTDPIKVYSSTGSGGATTGQ